MTPSRGDPIRLVDWDARSIEIVEDAPAGAPELPEEASDPPAPAPSVLPGSRKVLYEEDRVIAYFDEAGNAVEPHFATWAKVWTKDGALEIISLKDNPPPGTVNV